MAANMRRSAAPLITTIQKLFSEDLAKERMTFSYPISRAAGRRAGEESGVGRADARMSEAITPRNAREIRADELKHTTGDRKLSNRPEISCRCLS